MRNLLSPHVHVRGRFSISYLNLLVSKVFTFRNVCSEFCRKNTFPWRLPAVFSSKYIPSASQHVQSFFSLIEFGRTGVGDWSIGEHVMSMIDSKDERKGGELDIHKDKGSRKDVEKVLLLCTRGVTYR